MQLGYSVTSNVPIGSIEESKNYGIGWIINTSKSVHPQSSKNVTFIFGDFIRLSDPSHAQLVDSATLLQSYNLNPRDALQSTFVESPITIFKYILAVNKANQEHTTKSPSVLNIVATTNITHTQTVDSPTLLFRVYFVGKKAIHAQRIKVPLLVQHHILDVFDSTQEQRTDSLEVKIALFSYGELFVQSTDNTLLIQKHILNLSSVKHNQLVKSPNLVQHHILSIVDSLHIALSDSSLVIITFELFLDNPFQQHRNNEPTVKQKHVIIVNSILHKQQVESLLSTDVVAGSVLQRIFIVAP